MEPVITTADDRAPLDPLAPRLPLDPEPTERQLLERWQHWRPLVLIHVRKLYADRLVEQMMDHYAILHRRIVLQCLLLGLSWATIRTRELDDPRLSITEGQYRINHASYLCEQATEREMKRREQRGEFHDRRRQ